MSSLSDLCQRCDHVRDAHRPSCYDDRQGECSCVSFVEPSPVERWAFTFGVGQRNHDRFVTIEAAGELAARRLMIDAYGREWSSVYRWDDFVPQIERYGYVELPFGENQ